MNNELFQQAKMATTAADYNRALDLYARCLEDQANPLQSGEMGLIYHQIGNCLSKLHSYYEAIEAYTRATADTDYDASGVVNCNLGMAYAALRDWQNAVKHFEIAVSDRSYPTPYKAYTGMGNALMKQGKSAEAGVAYREAALDESNPDPTKALLNLGVCFMALNRPADAVASYESAMQFDMSTEMRNKMYSSLGQAYTASGQMQKAVESFERAIEDKTYFLSDSASVDYQRAIAAVSQGTSESTQALPALADTSGLDVASDGSAITSEQDPFVVADEVSQDYYFTDEYTQENGAVSGEEQFFNATDEEIEQWSRGMVKMERRRRGVGLKIVIAVLVVVLLVLGSGVVLYLNGFGMPTQQMAVEQLFSNPSSQDAYVNEIDPTTIEHVAAIIPEGSTVTVNGMNKTPNDSVVYATGTTPQGGEVLYEIDLRRNNFIGWKVADADLYFVSQN